MGAYFKSVKLKKSGYALLAIAVLLAVAHFVKQPVDKRTQYEQLLNSHPFSQALSQSTDEEGAENKYDRPDLAMMQEFLRTMDPAWNTCDGLTMPWRRTWPVRRARVAVWPTHMPGSASTEAFS